MIILLGACSSIYIEVLNVSTLSLHGLQYAGIPECLPWTAVTAPSTLHTFILPGACSSIYIEVLNVSACSTVRRYSYFLPRHALTAPPTLHKIILLGACSSIYTEVLNVLTLRLQF